ncbi:MAG: 16S rRNA (guanine(527)-N(7))-methyltransferase RsmG [Gallionella sp.]
MLSADQRDSLLKYIALLHKWNKVYNLTAIREPRQMLCNHLLDSLAVIPHLWPGRWLDVGCGAGLPGVVLAVAQPGWKFTLLDSNSKKTSFVNQAIIELDLRNIEVRCSRVELWQTNDKFDGVISRAFSELGEFVQKTRHLMGEGGSWVAMKGQADTELLNIPTDCKVESVITLTVPGLNAQRSLVIATCEGSKIT